MREIKFRAWEKSMKQMISVNGIDLKKKMINKDSTWRMLDEIELMQFTGLYDKCGKEIYEGDIVVATYGKWHEEPKGLTRICKVVYDDKTCSFRMAVNNSKVLVYFGDSRRKDIEIIGNIFKNPELLEVTHESK
jgi:uncharacterized phage protein (TIGR01671 family)